MQRLGSGLRRSLWRGVAALALVFLVVTVSSAHASTILSQGWESGLGGWTTTGDFWHVQTNPQTISVKSPDINPNLVTLPDSGRAADAFDGTSVAWFGEASTGTFCGSDFASVTQTAKEGCTSSRPYSGQLISPPFSLAGANSAIVRFYSWWEIESMDADGYDVMTVEYSTDGGSTWSVAASSTQSTIPPANTIRATRTMVSSSHLGWKEYLVDLSPAVGQPNVQIRFNFNTNDTLYNGFRGWLSTTWQSTPRTTPGVPPFERHYVPRLLAAPVWQCTARTSSRTRPCSSIQRSSALRALPRRT